MRIEKREVTEKRATKTHMRVLTQRLKGGIKKEQREQRGKREAQMGRKRVGENMVGRM